MLILRKIYKDEGNPRRVSLILEKFVSDRGDKKKVSFILGRFLSGQEEPMMTPIFKNISKRRRRQTHINTYI
jgi:hypothetical protein